MSKLAKLEQLDPDIVYDFIDKGTSRAISKDLQVFISQIQWAAEIWTGERNITRAAKKLQTRIHAAYKLPVSINTCKSRLYDALNYFDVDHNVAQEVWDRDTANKLEDLALQAIAEGKLEVANRCYNKANELRARANSSLKAEDLRPPMFLISPNITAEDLGFSSERVLAISKKANEGVYAQMISELPIEKQEKLRLMADAEITDVDFEEMDNGSTSKS